MMMLLPSAYLPPVSYLQLCLQSKAIQIEAKEHFVKQTLRNRCYIYGANGKMALIVPVQHQDLSHTPMDRVKIAYSESWQKIHWRSIESAYRKSPYFEYFEEEFRPFYFQEYEHLIDWNEKLTAVLFNLIKLNIQIQRSTSYQTDIPSTNDQRAAFGSEPDPSRQFAPYFQAFSNRHGFIPDLSAIDLLFNLGAGAKSYLSTGNKI